MAVINETNQQYYAGAQGFVVKELLGETDFTFTFDTDLIFGSFDPSDINYQKNNFKLYSSIDGLTYNEYINSYTVTGNTISLGVALPFEHVLVCQLKRLDGGSYGNRDAYGSTTEQNYGSYEYITLNDVVNNFIVAYVGAGKLIPSVKRTDLIFHAKRALQEFSYDTLKSIKSQELTIPPSLSVVIPQDYVNYVRMSWIDMQGVQRIIYPANNLTDSPYRTPIQDGEGVPTQDNFGENLQGTSTFNPITLLGFATSIANFAKKYNFQKIIIGYDNRFQSKSFAILVSHFFLEKNFKIKIFDDICSTPELAFSVKKLHSDLGIIITASHNDKRFNGLKIMNSIEEKHKENIDSIVFSIPI